MPRLPILFAALLCAAPAAAQSQCVPLDTSALILAKPAPEWVHPDWADGSQVGLAWTLEVTDTEDNGEGLYLYGDLYGPDGGLVTEGVYAIADEWDCGG
jgi:hypothetical protein